jgi:hypothetical protein
MNLVAGRPATVSSVTHSPLGDVVEILESLLDADHRPMLRHGTVVRVSAGKFPG